MKGVSAMRHLMILGAFAAFLGGQAAWAQSPVAIVEEVSDSVKGIEFMEYVDRGRNIKLGSKGMLILGYLRSCVRETINGGSVTVGKEQSTVQGGKVTRERVECDGGKLQLTLEQASKSAVIVFRKAPRAKKAAPPHKLYGTAPLIRAQKGVREISIQRIDRPGKAMRYAVVNRVVDLAAKGMNLERRGVYRVRSGKRKVVIRIDANATPGAGPLVGRLISF
jgi:hypothetical protein